MTFNLKPLDLDLWQQSFYLGNRLVAEIQLSAAFFTGDISLQQAIEGFALLQTSFGKSDASDFVSPFQKFQSSFPEPANAAESRNQYFAAVDCPDSLLLWVLLRRLPELGQAGSNQNLYMLSRAAQLLLKRFPQRPDLPYQLIIREPTGSLLKVCPSGLLQPYQWYSSQHAYLSQLQVAWVQGRYESMWLGSLRSQVDGRYFPISDHHIRGFSIIGEDERCLRLFQCIYNNSPGEFQLGSISNLFFMALGCEKISQAFVNTLSSHFQGLASAAVKKLPALPALPVLPQRLTVHEKPLLVVVSTDLRNHPVGRFWLPIARHLRSRFRLIHVAGAPRDADPIRAELHELSDDWWPMEASDVSAIASRIRGLAPSILLDLGGHTADNHPALLCHRLATIQATYLGFYGPTYATCCDWWIIDRVLERWLANSYPGAEKFWSLPGPSLCYLPDLHSLPNPDDIFYREPNHLVYGSFNHTRKITKATQQRFGAVLSASPHAVLQFRSHSFHDPSVRRYFLQRFIDAGISSHQLQPLPYAPSSSEAMSDYGRIHLHLDSYPVSGTTTTLDSLAMGIPVLTCPTPYYAGAISAAILEHAGLADHVCSDLAQLPSHARWLAERYRTAGARDHWLVMYANHRSVTLKRCQLCLAINLLRCCVKGKAYELLGIMCIPHWLLLI